MFRKFGFGREKRDQEELNKVGPTKEPRVKEENRRQDSKESQVGDQVDQKQLLSG